MYQDIILHNKKLQILLLGPGDLSNDEVMLSKRKDVERFLKEYDGVECKYFTRSSTVPDQDWLSQVRSYVFEKGVKHIICLLSPSVSLYAEMEEIVKEYKSICTVFYNYNQLEDKDSELKTIIDAINRNFSEVLVGYGKKSIINCNIVSDVRGIVSSLLRNLI